MGQVVGRMPYTWGGLLEEKDRVLYWSSEVLSKVIDNINQEESLRIDYSNEVIDEKVDSWIVTNRTRIEDVLSKRTIIPEELRLRILITISKIREELRIKMRNDYRRGYADFEKFMRKVGELGKQQQKIHMKIEKLEEICVGDVEKFQKKFGPLRLKTFKNLKMGEQMVFQNKQLKAIFAKRVCNTDYKNMKKCTERFDKLINAIEVELQKL